MWYLMDPTSRLHPTHSTIYNIVKTPNIRIGLGSKTSILQRVCETRESPKIYRVSGGTREEIHLDPTAECGNHHIEDELVFANHNGYVFHDSCGFEAGHEDELHIVQDFVREKATARQLWDRLHAIWYCIPMENDQPSFDMKFFGAICPDKNVPVIAVFTKFDQFKRDIRIKLEDRPGGNPSVSWKEVNDRAEEVFQDQYWNVVKHAQETENALSDEVVTLMLLAIQRGNLERSVKNSLRRQMICYSKIHDLFGEWYYVVSAISRLMVYVPFLLSRILMVYVPFLLSSLLMVHVSFLLSSLLMVYVSFLHFRCTHGLCSIPALQEDSWFMSHSYSLVDSWFMSHFCSPGYDSWFMFHSYSLVDSWFMSHSHSPGYDSWFMFHSYSLVGCEQYHMITAIPTHGLCSIPALQVTHGLCPIPALQEGVSDIMGAIPRLMVYVCPIPALQTHKHITDTLSSMIGKIGSATFNDGYTPQYTLLVSILLLECTAILFVTTDATLDTALDEAYSGLNSLSNALKAELSSFVSKDHITDDYLAFILKHRLAT
ncbi:hypothetical protein HD554DRAFT_2280572 [Boletus coccyginus]|nr:hypothetical protein HD554DRAFT_2280572 [Boletus coccyginus]